VEAERNIIPTIDCIWLEVHEDGESCDVIVRMDNSAMYTAHFVTLSFLKRQMELNYELSQLVEDTIPVHFTTLDTPHVLVENLNRDTIEDTIDNLIVMETFESLFTRVTETEDDATTTTTTATTGQRATQEVAAVVVSEVLVVKD
jgi:hypothetical protein